MITFPDCLKLTRQTKQIIKFLNKKTLQIRKLMFELCSNYMRDIIYKQKDGLPTINPGLMSSLLNNFQSTQTEYPILSGSPTMLEEPVWVSVEPIEYNAK